METENKFYIENKYETIIVQKEKCNEEEILLIKSILQKNKN